MGRKSQMRMTGLALDERSEKAHRELQEKEARERRALAEQMAATLALIAARRKKQQWREVPSEL